MKIADSVKLSLFMASNEMCKTGHAASTGYFQKPIFKMALNELSDSEGPQHTYCNNRSNSASPGLEVIKLFYAQLS